MSVYISVRVDTRIVCDCSAHKFPHPIGQSPCFAVLDHTKPLSSKVSKRTLRIIDGILANHR